MASLAQRLQSEINRANGTTSATDQTVHDAISRLIAGYGKGEGGGTDLEAALANVMGTYYSPSGGNVPRLEAAVDEQAEIMQAIYTALYGKSGSNGVYVFDDEPTSFDFAQDGDIIIVVGY